MTTRRRGGRRSWKPCPTASSKAEEDTMEVDGAGNRRAAQPVNAARLTFHRGQPTQAPGRAGGAFAAAPACQFPPTFAPSLPNARFFSSGMRTHAIPNADRQGLRFHRGPGESAATARTAPAAADARRLQIGSSGYTRSAAQADSEKHGQTRRRRQPPLQHRLDCRRLSRAVPQSVQRLETLAGGR